MSDVLENTLSFDDHDVLMRSIGEEIENAEGLNSLLEKGIDLNKLIDESSGLFPIHWACDYGNQKAVEILLDAGINIDLPDESFMPFTPMEHAAKAGHVELVKFLLDKGAQKTEMTSFCIGDNEELEKLLG